MDNSTTTLDFQMPVVHKPVVTPTPSVPVESGSVLPTEQENDVTISFDTGEEAAEKLLVNATDHLAEEGPDGSFKAWAEGEFDKDPRKEAAIPQATEEKEVVNSELQETVLFSGNQTDEVSSKTLSDEQMAQFKEQVVKAFENKPMSLQEVFATAFNPEMLKQMDKNQLKELSEELKTMSQALDSLLLDMYIRQQAEVAKKKKEEGEKEDQNFSLFSILAMMIKTMWLAVQEAMAEDHSSPKQLDLEEEFVYKQQLPKAA